MDINLAKANLAFLGRVTLHPNEIATYQHLIGTLQAQIAQAEQQPDMLSVAKQKMSEGKMDAEMQRLSEIKTPEEKEAR